MAPLRTPGRRRHRLTFPVATFPGPRELVLYRVGMVPITVVVGTGGRVLHVRSGRLESPAAVDSILTAAFPEEGTARAAPDSLTRSPRGDSIGTGRVRAQTSLHPHQRR